MGLPMMSVVASHCPGALPPVSQIISNIESEFLHLTVRAPFNCFFDNLLPLGSSSR